MDELLRYEHKGRETHYWLKYSNETRTLLHSLRTLVGRTTRRVRKDR